MKMASDLKFGMVEEMWFEGNLTTVVATIRGGSSLYLTSDVLPVGRLSHEARALRPIIEDLIEGVTMFNLPPGNSVDTEADLSVG